MSMPKQKPGKSKQDYQTPGEFMTAFTNRFGGISHDLAASPENTQSESYFTESQNAFGFPWHAIKGHLWLNPPFADIEPWAERCKNEMKLGAKIFMLVPASVGSNWYKDFVEPYAVVLALNPRLKFVGAKDMYPKDLILACYLHGLTGFQTWRWK